MSLKKRIAALHRKPGLVIAGLLAALVAMTLVNLFNVMTSPVEDAHSTITLLVLCELIVIALFLYSMLKFMRNPGPGEKWQTLSNAFEDSHSGFAVFDLDGRFMEVNPAWCRLIGYAPQELKGKTFQEITHEEDLAPDLALVQELLDDKRSFYRLKKRYIHKNGEVVWIELRAALIRDENNKPLYFIGQIDKAAKTKPNANVYPYDHSNQLFRIVTELSSSHSRTT